MKVKARVSLVLAALLGLSSWCASVRAQTPVVQQIPWTIKTPSFATGKFLVSRGLSYSSSGIPVAWSEQGTESFRLGNAAILLGKYKPLSNVDFSRQMWLTIKAKKSDGTWVTIAKNQRAVLWSFNSMWSDEAGHAAAANTADTASVATTASHSDTADTAGVATTATSATTCTNWTAVSCPDGQCLKGFTASGTPTCVPCGTGSGGTSTPIPFDQTNWTGHRWDQNVDAGAWFPSVSAGVATYLYDDTSAAQTISVSTVSRDQTVSFEVNFSLASGGANSDRGYFGFSTGYVGYTTADLAAVEFNADGNAYLVSKSGSGPVRGATLGSYTKSAWIPVTMNLTPGGDFVFTISGATYTNNASSTFAPTTFNIVITGWDSADGFQVRNLSVQ